MKQSLSFLVLLFCAPAYAMDQKVRAESQLVTLQTAPVKSDQGQTPKSLMALAPTLWASMLVKERAISCKIHEGPVRLSFSADGSLITISQKNSTSSWDVATGKLLADACEVEFDPLRVISNSGKLLLTIGMQGTAYLCATKDGDSKDENGTHGDAKDDKHVITFAPDVAKQVKVRSGQFSHDDHSLVLTTYNRLDGTSTCTLWDVAKGTLLQTLTLKKTKLGQISFAEFDTSDTLILVAGPHAYAMIWDIATGRVLRMLPHTALVVALCSNATSLRIATICRDGVLTIWGLSPRLYKSDSKHSEQSEEKNKRGP